MYTITRCVHVWNPHDKEIKAGRVQVAVCLGNIETLPHKKKRQAKKNPDGEMLSMWLITVTLMMITWLRKCFCWILTKMSFFSFYAVVSLQEEVTMHNPHCIPAPWSRRAMKHLEFCCKKKNTYKGRFLVTYSAYQIWLFQTTSSWRAAIQDMSLCWTFHSEAMPSTITQFILPFISWTLFISKVT